MNFRPSITNRQRQASDMDAERRTDLACRRIGSYVHSPRSLGWRWPANDGDDVSAVTMLLFNVTVERTLGPLKVLMSPDKTVRELIKVALQMYRNEKRRPFLKESDPRRFQLHYSQFSLEKLSTDEKLINLGSRNFFLCSKRSSKSKAVSSSSLSITSSYRSNHDTTHDYPFPFPMANLMDLLL